MVQHHTSRGPEAPAWASVHRFVMLSSASHARKCFTTSSSRLGPHHPVMKFEQLLTCRSHSWLSRQGWYVALSFRFSSLSFKHDYGGSHGASASITTPPNFEPGLIQGEKSATRLAPSVPAPEMRFRGYLRALRTRLEVRLHLVSPIHSQISSTKTSTSFSPCLPSLSACCCIGYS